ncbi:right-handed parallel beta-helix repeat-containing protein [Pontiella sulfatireligans]|uniref:Putative outer membrane protein PmpB n=1 Tax=Pontiella sulfatireligans TaxID=2750658 RepID=A0A6C2UMP5_9BACT|nr:right-handed parallel beta-helix repeat-containing protein [Pontiella sulfatireligans]VGO21279.1 putative outer membrane protein PmpB [Pontiella sulfatireligans]
MKSLFYSLIALFGILLSSGQATPFYVDDNMPDDSADGLSWETAKQSIQAAVDLTVDGDTVLVTNGTYATGSRATSSYADSWPNRVLIDKAITVQSVNGPDVTLIDGSDTVRAVYIEAGARLDGFTITGGRTSSDDSLYTQRSGGGILARPSWGSNPTITNCVITANRAFFQGGGADLSRATLLNCKITDNYSSSIGGGLVLNNSTVTFCSISENRAQSTGGGFSADNSTISCCSISENESEWLAGACLLENDTKLNSSIISYNHTENGAAIKFFNGGSLNFCTVVRNWSDGIGDGSAEVNSCIIHQNSGIDIPTVNSTMHHSCSPDLAHGFSHNITNAPNFRKDRIRLDYDSPCRGAGEWAPVDIPYDFAGNPRNLGTPDMGAYATAPMIFVDGNFTPDDSGDGYTLETAKRTLQAGADTAHALLTNNLFLSRVELWVLPIFGGSYQEGGVAAPNSMWLMNRLAVSSNIWVYAIEGSFSSPVIDGGNTMRCVYLGENSRLEGFTLQNGKTAQSGLYTDVDGGGALIEKNAFITDCTIQSNYARFFGGGVYLNEQATMTDCILTANNAGFPGGGAYLEPHATMNGCELTSNHTDKNGGGAYLDNAAAVNCTLNRNEASQLGGGLYLFGSSAEECPLGQNEAETGGGAYLDDSDLTDCIIGNCTASLEGGGVYATNSTVTACTLRYNESAGKGGGAFLIGDSALQSSTVSGNGSLEQGGGIYVEGVSQVTSCTVDYNEAETGGGIYLKGTSFIECPTVNQALLANNEASGGNGAGLYLYQNGILRNCTIVANRGTGLNLYYPRQPAGSLLNTGGKVYNSIVWGNRDGDIDTFGPCDISNTCARDGVEHLVNNCLTIYPRFYGGTYPYSLSNDSPCLNAGDDSQVTATTDLYGNARIEQGASDLGVYEHRYGAQTADTDLDGLPDSWEDDYFETTNLCLSDDDSDEDGFSNLEEYYAGTNPTNDNSFMQFTLEHGTNQVIELNWTMNNSKERIYHILWTPSLTNQFEHLYSTTTQSNRTINLDPNADHYSTPSQYSSGFFRCQILLPNEPYVLD